MTSDDPNGTNEQSCPKRLWVLLTLSDDELMASGSKMPRGLEFHLSRCESCRVVADRLLHTSNALETLGPKDASPDLLEAARAQAINALRDGARLTGRVEIPDEPAVHVTPAWYRYARYAVAAAIVLAVGLLGISAYVGDVREQLVEGKPPPPDSWVVNERSGERGVMLPHEEPSRIGPEPTPSPERAVSLTAASDDAAPFAQPRIRRHRSHIEAALADGHRGAQAAVVLPDTSQRDLGWGRVFDKSYRLMSTKPSQDGR